MYIAHDLFDSVIPPAIWVTLHDPEPALTDNRKITVRVKPFGQRSFTLTVWVSNYSPEASVFLAISKWIGECHIHQGPMTQLLAQEILDTAVENYIEPF